MSVAELHVLASVQSRRETQLQRLVSFYIVTGMLFMLLPGTFLGVLNLISISDRPSVGSEHS